MKQLADLLLDRLSQSRVDYADVRISLRREEEISVRNGKPEVVRGGESFGYGIRVLKNGCWGFAACSDVTSDWTNRAIERAVLMAEAAAIVARDRDRFEPPPPATAFYATPFRVDPFAIPLEDKIALLAGCTDEMAREKDVRHAEGYFDAVREKKLFVSTVGSAIEQDIVECGAGIAAYAIHRGEMQVRSYPSSFRGNFATAGYEFVQAMDLAQAAPRVAAEAVELLKAPPCPEGEFDVIVMPDQLALQIHESIGHPLELDRIFGYEASFAGTSFVGPDDIGQLGYGAGCVNVTADATTPLGLGTFGYDDEGVPACREPLIREGILVGVLSSCSTAPRIGRRSSGCMRADGWSNLPLVRMTNINLEPGDWELDDLIADTGNGLILETNKSWSIDDRRINFQFATETAREIRDGKPGRLYRNPVYSGVTTRFWNSCDAICNAKHWRLWGIPNCGKGEPMQTAHVGHGCAPARFRKVRTGSAGS